MTDMVIPTCSSHIGTWLQDRHHLLGMHPLFLKYLSLLFRGSRIITECILFFFKKNFTVPLLVAPGTSLLAPPPQNQPYPYPGPPQPPPINSLSLSLICLSLRSLVQPIAFTLIAILPPSFHFGFGSTYSIHTHCYYYFTTALVQPIAFTTLFYFTLLHLSLPFISLYTIYYSLLLHFPSLYSFIFHFHFLSLLLIISPYSIPFTTYYLLHLLIFIHSILFHSITHLHSFSTPLLLPIYLFYFISFIYIHQSYFLQPTNQFYFIFFPIPPLYYYITSMGKGVRG